MSRPCWSEARAAARELHIVFRLSEVLSVTSGDRDDCDLTAFPKICSTSCEPVRWRRMGYLRGISRRPRRCAIDQETIPPLPCSLGLVDESVRTGRGGPCAMCSVGIPASRCRSAHQAAQGAAGDGLVASSTRTRPMTRQPVTGARISGPWTIRRWLESLSSR